MKQSFFFARVATGRLEGRSRLRGYGAGATEGTPASLAITEFLP
jgi:hypothetical protein